MIVYITHLLFSESDGNIQLQKGEKPHGVKKKGGTKIYGTKAALGYIRTFSITG